MKIIGLTGGIGSGKTTVAKEFQKLNVPVYIADERSKLLLSNNSSVISDVKALLGEDSYKLVDGIEQADRRLIAQKVFNDQSLLKGLNNILHPAVHKDFNDYCLLQKNASYVLYEAAILFETGGQLRCDATILVTASKKDRLERVMQRDQVTKDEVETRMNNQWSQEKKLELANLVIINNNLILLAKKVNLIHFFIIKNQFLLATLFLLTFG